MIDLKGKNAVVTGAARGIGKSTALTLAKAGANIVIADLNEESSKTTAEEIAKQTGIKAIGIGTNVADSDSAAKAIQACVDTFGSVDILVNNAGITKDTLLMRMKKNSGTR